MPKTWIHEPWIAQKMDHVLVKIQKIRIPKTWISTNLWIKLLKIWIILNFFSRKKTDFFENMGLKNMDFSEKNLCFKYITDKNN